MPHVSLNDHQRINWLRLIRTPSVGSSNFFYLINQFGSAESALEALPNLSASAGAKIPLKIPSTEEIEKEINEAKKIGARFIAVGEKEYPKNLASIENPPPILSVQGCLDVFSSSSIAIVGARNASIGGMKLAEKLSKDLGKNGFIIVSGLARGIDTATHQGALESGTIAVLAGGLHKPYPLENIPLLQEIIEKGGAVVSEMPIHWEARAKDFPRRNRIIAGISMGIVVVEATQRSGSLITARMGLEMGRDIFAVPGSPFDPRCAGTNQLLKNGAILITEAHDVIEHISPMIPKQQMMFQEEEKPFDFSSKIEWHQKKILEALGSNPISMDEIIQYTELHPAVVSMILLELDLAGKIERHEDGKISLTFFDRR